MNIIETKGITKMFGDFCANSDINIAIKQGEIRAIIGENGAGKTTLMNMLYGMVQPSYGEIYVAGQKVKFASPKDAIKHKLGMVHQHFKLVPSLTVYENILLGAEMVKGGLINNKKERQVISALIEKYKFDLNVDDKIECISVGARQRVEILKMLYRDVDVLILDEPTSVLTPGEVDDLIQNLLELREQGKTMIIITHKLQEVKKLANTITVIRRGKVVGTVDTESVTMEDLAQMMVGRPVIMQVDKGENGAGDREVVYQVEHLSAQDAQGVRQLVDVSFAVRRGEVLGVAGVEGNGQSELVKVLSGMMKCCEGAVTLGDKAVTNAWPDKLRGCGVGIVPEDRYEQGLCLDMTVSQNLIAGYHRKKPVCNGLLMSGKEIAKNQKDMVRQFDIRLSSDDPNVSGLSGGNAQKIIIAREFTANPDFLLCCQPTRGVDIGSIEFIHKNLIKIRDEGKAVLLVSSELTEIMSLSDRIIVMYKGEITGEFEAGQVTPEELGCYMTGAKKMLRAQAAV